MKMILQKHTSKFVAGLFNSLGIIACVSLTSCGGENKVKQTENQGEDLKNGLKSKGLDERDANAIAAWLEKNKKDISGLKEDDLQEIFGEDTAKIKEVAGKLGVELNESDNEFDDEEEKEINKWLTKLNSLENADFNRLDEGLKEKVAQKFIDNEIDIANNADITTKLAGFINEVVEEKKASEITLKIEGEGKVSIVKVADKTTTDFTFDTFEVFEKFVDYLKDKEITSEEVKLSFAFTGKNVKIGGHGTGFDITDCVVDLLNYFEALTKITALNLQVSGLSLKVESGTLSLNEVDCTAHEYCKSVKFWNLVKDHAAFFGIAKGSKFEIEKDGGEQNAVVKIGELKTKLAWSEVVVSENTFKENSGWNNIFKFKNEEQTVKTDVTVEFENGKCTCKEINGYEEGVELKNLDALGKLVKDLKNKKVTIGGSKNFSLAFADKIVKVCGHGTGFEVMKDADFATLLECVKSLKEVGVVENGFKIAITVDSDDIKLDNVKIDQGFMKTQNFWNAVKAHKDGLFGNLGSGKIKVSKVGSNKHVKIGSTELELDVLKSDGGGFGDGWDDIFEISGSV